MAEGVDKVSCIIRIVNRQCQAYPSRLGLHCHIEALIGERSIIRVNVGLSLRTCGIEELKVNGPLPQLRNWRRRRRCCCYAAVTRGSINA